MRVQILEKVGCIMKKIIYLLALTALILIIIPYSLTDINAESDSYHASHLSAHEFSSKTLVGQASWSKEQNVELTDEQIDQVLDQFMDHLLQKTDEEFRVLNYQSLEDYKSSFKGLATSNVVDQYVDEIYFEKGQALYFKPTDTPPWFESDQPFDKEKLDERTYRISQSNENELHGNYHILIDLKLNENNEPYIINVQYQ